MGTFNSAKVHTFQTTKTVMELMRLRVQKFTDFLVFMLCCSFYDSALPIRHDPSSIQPQHVAPLRSVREDFPSWLIVKLTHGHRKKPFDGTFEWFNLVVAGHCSFY